VQDPFIIEITGRCRCLAILGQNETYVLYFLPPPPLLQKMFPRHCFMLTSNRAYLRRQPWVSTMSRAALYEIKVTMCEAAGTFQKYEIHF